MYISFEGDKATYTSYLYRLLILILVSMATSESAIVSIAIVSLAIVSLAIVSLAIVSAAIKKRWANSV